MALNFAFTADNRQFMSTLSQIQNGVDETTRQIEANGGSIERVINNLKGRLIALGIGTGLKEIAGQVASVRGEYQQLEVAFETMLGNKEKSDALMAQMIRTAAITPFGMNDVTNGAKSLLAYGVAAEDVNDTLIRLGDIAAGLSIPLNDLTYLYGTTIVQGRMFTQDLRQFQGRGIPIAAELAKQFGVAENKVGDLVTAGKVTSKEFIAAIKSMTDEGSMFGGLMEKQSQTITGQISNIEDAIEQMFNEIGKQTEGIISDTLSVTSAIVENWQTVVMILADVAAAYGVQKAALALDAGFSAAKTNYGYDIEIAQLQTLIPMKEEAEKSDLEAAVASGRLTEAKAVYITALREEVNAQLEALAAKEATAKAEEASALARAAAAEKEVDAIDAEIEAVNERFAAALAGMDAEEAETFATELDTLETMRNEAANIAQTLSEEARTAATNAAAAAEERETLATQINTAQTSSNTAATSILTIAKDKLTAAMVRLNAVMKANQFAIITGAVIALGYAIYKLCTYQTEEQKLMEKVSKATMELDIEINKEIKTLDRLKERLENANKGTSKWKSVKDEIVSKYGSYLSGLDSEIEKTGTLATTYDELSKAVRRSMVARKIAKYEEDNQVDVTDNLDEVRELLAGKFNYRVADGGIVKNNEIPEDLQREFMQQYSAYLSDLDETKLDKRLRNILQSNGKRTWHGTYETYLKRTTDKREELIRNREGAEKIAANNGFTYDEAVGNTDNQPKTTETNLKVAYDKAKKDYEDAKKLVDTMNANRSAYTQEAYETATSNLKSYKDAFEKLGGETKTKKTSGSTPEQIAAKTASDEQQLRDLIVRQQNERDKLEQDYEYTRWQNRIDLMDEGEAKILAQMELNHAKERDSLRQQETQSIKDEIARQKAIFDAQEDVKASKNKKYAKLTFNPQTDVDMSAITVIHAKFAALEEDLTQSHIKAENDRLQASKDAYDEYLKEFGSYQQKREALERAYASRIEEAQNDGERMTLTAQRDKALSDLDYEEWVDTGSIALAFGDISRLSDSTVTKLIEDMERYRDKVVSTFDPQKIAEYEAALNSLRQIQSDESSGIFSTVVPDYFKERKSVASQKDSAADNVNALYEKRATIYNRILALQKQIEAAKAKGEDTSGLESELREQQVALDSNSSAAKKAVDSFKLLQEQWDRLDSPEEKFRGICDALSQVSGLASGLTDSMSGMFADLGMDGAASAIGTVSEVIGSVGNVANGFANGGMVGGIAAAASEVFKWGGKLFGAKESDPHLLEDIERMTAVNEELTNAIDRLSAKMDKASLAEAGDIYEQQLEYLKASMANTQEMMARSGAAYGKHHSSNYRIDNSMSGADWQRISKIVGTTVRGAGDFWNLTSEQMALVAENAAELYAKIKQLADDGNNDAAQFMDDYISYYEQINELEDAYQQKITDTTFDSVRDSFKSTLLDMESDADSFAESFEDILRNAVVSSMMSDVFDKQIKEWYDAFSEAMREDGLSLDEKDILRDRWDSIVGDAIKQRDELLETLGLDAASSTAQQKATAGGYETMSEDTATELNGRFTAIQDSNERIAQSVLATLTYLQNLTATVGGGNEILGNILLQHVRTNEYLDDIKRYTKELQTFGEKFDKIVENTNKL